MTQNAVRKSSKRPPDNSNHLNSNTNPINPNTNSNPDPSQSSNSNCLAQSLSSTTLEDQSANQHNRIHNHNHNHNHPNYKSNHPNLSPIDQQHANTPILPKASSSPSSYCDSLDPPSGGSSYSLSSEASSLTTSSSGGRVSNSLPPASFKMNHNISPTEPFNASPENPNNNKNRAFVGCADDPLNKGNCNLSSENLNKKSSHLNNPLQNSLDLLPHLAPMSEDAQSEKTVPKNGPYHQPATHLNYGYPNNIMHQFLTGAAPSSEEFEDNDAASSGDSSLKLQHALKIKTPAPSATVFQPLTDHPLNYSSTEFPSDSDSTLVRNSPLFHFPGDMRHHNISSSSSSSPHDILPTSHLTLSIPADSTFSAASSLPSSRQSPPQPSSAASSIHSKTDSPASATFYNDLTPLPSPLLPSDSMTNVFKAFNGCSPPTTTISRAPSMRSAALRYGVDRSSPYKNTYRSSSMTGSLGSSVSSSQSPPFLPRPATTSIHSNADVSDDSDCVLTESTNTRAYPMHNHYHVDDMVPPLPKTSPTRRKGDRSVSDYVPVPATPTRMTTYHKPTVSPTFERSGIPSQEPVLHVIKQRTPRKQKHMSDSEAFTSPDDSGSQTDDDDATPKRRTTQEISKVQTPRSASSGAPAPVHMKREQSATSPSKHAFKKPQFDHSKLPSINDTFTKAHVASTRLLESSPESPESPKKLIPPSASCQKEINEILNSPALSTLSQTATGTTTTTASTLAPTVTATITAPGHGFGIPTTNAFAEIETKPVPIPAKPPRTEEHHQEHHHEHHQEHHHRHHHHHHRENEVPLIPERVFEAYDTDMNKSTWNEIKSLGRGAFSKVLLACPADRYLKPEYQGHALDYKVAIKIVDIGHAEQHSRERMEAGLKREIGILKKIQYPSLILMYAFNIDSTSALMVLPHCEGGDLFEFVAKHRNKITVGLARRIFGDVARAVAFLHENNVVHRDIKLENVLLNIPVPEIFDIEDYDKYPKSIATLTDLGLSRQIDPEDPMLTTRCGSEDYVPPELLMGQPYDGRQTDSWALGVLLYAMMEGRLPFDPPSNVSARRGRGRIAHRIARVEWSWLEYRDYDSSLHDSGTSWAGAKKIVEGCLQKRDIRLMASEIALMPWVQLGFTMKYPWPFDISMIFK